MSVGRHTTHRRAGMTLVELVIATGLASVVIVALFRLMDVTLDMWSRGETRRSMVERASTTGELLSADLRALHPGEQGDLLAEWVPFDVDGDGLLDRWWPRMRLVRQASVEDLARIAIERAALESGPSAPSPEVDEEVSTAREAVPLESGLVEVAWAVVPAGGSGEARYEGLLVRGERLIGSDGLGEFFDEDWFGPRGLPPAGSTREVSGGLLWFGLQFATQTTVVWEGWKIGEMLEDSAASWDAWNRRRPDGESHVWNEPGAGMPAVEDAPLLPRRVRLELEFQSARERTRRTRLSQSLSKGSAVIRVDEPDGLPGSRADHILVGGEWRELLRGSGDSLTVRRGVRGTSPLDHDVGTLVHWGDRIVIELPISTHSDDWNLLGGVR